MPLKSMTGNDCLVVSHSFTVFLVYYMLPFFGGLSNHWFDHGSAITVFLGLTTPYLQNLDGRNTVINHQFLYVRDRKKNPSIESKTIESIESDSFLDKFPPGFRC